MNSTATNWAWVVVLLSLSCFGAGCATSSSARSPQPDPKAGNIYRPSPRMPAQVRRVAVLPMTAGRRDLTFDAGLEALQPVLLTELTKREAFEVDFVSPDQLGDWTGKRAWTAEEKLPQNFFDVLREASGCDAVLFCRLTEFRPYAPMAVGWHMTLVTVGEPKILWASDRVFDAGDAGTGNAARRYYHAHIWPTGALADPSSILYSPRRFGQYTASAVLESLPQR